MSVLQDENLCGDSLNKFHDLMAIQDKYPVSHSIDIQGQRLNVLKAMTYKRKWLSRNWINPMHFYAEKFERIKNGRKKANVPKVNYTSNNLEYDPEDDDISLLRGRKQKRKCCCIIV